MSKRVENQKRGYRTASEYAAQAAARIQINENGYIDIVCIFYFKPTFGHATLPYLKTLKSLKTIEVTIRAKIYLIIRIYRS